ncbi:hypothetical protein V1503_24425 [Bacillus sp. SCS-151]|uniref:hypothetical protein n=1 Tax=Nanhaiella sioensis TaxID=3115293 RepID=UPI003979C65B
MENKPNYHGTLYNIAPRMDRLLQIFTNSSSRTQVTSHWLVYLLMLELKDIPKFFKVITKLKPTHSKNDEKDITNINLTIIPLLFGGVIPTTTKWLTEIQWYWLIGIGLASFILFLIVIAPLYFSKMLNVYHPDFHLPAYMQFRKNEYELLNHSVIDPNFSYAGLSQYVNGVVTKQDDVHRAVQLLKEEHTQRVQEMKSEKDLIQQKHEEAIEKYKEAVALLEDELIFTEDIVTYLLDFLSEINLLLKDMSKGIYRFSDLRLLTGFTLYTMEGDTLIQIAAEKPYIDSEVSLNIHENELDDCMIPAVIVATEKESVPQFFQTKEGYFIISYYMKLKSSEWIINFQIDKERNPRAWYLLATDDIIDSKYIMNIFHSLCLLMEGKVTKEEDEKNEFRKSQNK